LVKKYLTNGKNLAVHKYLGGTWWRGNVSSPFASLIPEILDVIAHASFLSVLQRIGEPQFAASVRAGVICDSRRSHVLALLCQHLAKVCAL
jgi:hypothetical protein